MTQIRDARVLVTGGASGIGRLLVRRLAKRGATMIVFDIDEAGLKALKEELAAEGSEIHTYVCDLSSRAAISDNAARVRDAAGGIDILINNAGIVSGRVITELTGEQVERTFAINTLAPIHLTREFIGGMIERGRGHVVTIASAGGLAGTAKLTDYCASKFGAVGFDDALRAELNYLGSDVVTTIVCPFYINTGMFDGVATRFPWLLPILDPDKVTDRIVRAIERDKRRLIMPWMVYSSWLVRLLPVSVGDWLMKFFGVTESMDKFRGRGGAH